ncbi:hypothetical protein OE88DRAFT_1740870 [Heliocybe sulcata]|uniref:Diphthamide biosynthesis protein 4 n=1 Tax=Heliocybe sulcata TaxID=5364 RepID=A0A5C3NHH5_9AGAM|nr:hypothetical protein OE88DRAFT_1740870 [Heliocybe sulcata]
MPAAYHRALLLHHPDKQIPNTVNSRPHTHTNGNDAITLIKEAYATLSSPALRAAYDTELASSRGHSGPRPAQLVSLEDFAEKEPDDRGVIHWTYGCRCGGFYVITEQEMEEDKHLVGCGSCSEVVWVGYEIAEEE